MAIYRKKITDNLLQWYSSHYRPLPWRVDATPYHVWVSEIMLQQTRIEAVIPYYHRFITALPDVSALANASEETLLKLWEGLGYYSRARNLQKAAQVIIQQYGGEMPTDYERLIALPGIGPYTAGAIASIAFSVPVPAVDGNVMRVLARLFGDDTDVLSTEGKKRFSDYAWELIPEQNPGRFNQAMMELGETICLPSGTPLCSECPLREVCSAYREGRVSQLPVRIKKTLRKIENRIAAVVITREKPPRVLLHRRDANGLLAGLWEFPNTLDADPLACLPQGIAPLCQPGDDLPHYKHLFSHIEWQMDGRIYYLEPTVTATESFAFATLEELRTTYPIPGAFRRYAELLPNLLNEEN